MYLLNFFIYKTEILKTNIVFMYNKRFGGGGNGGERKRNL